MNIRMWGPDSERPTRKRKGAKKKCTKGNVALPNKEQERVLVAALAVEGSRWRLLGRGLWVFIFVFEEDRRGQGEESPGRQGGRANSGCRCRATDGNWTQGIGQL